MGRRQAGRQVLLKMDQEGWTPDAHTGTLSPQGPVAGPARALTPERPAPGSMEEMVDSGPRVLMVEDDNSVRESVSAALRSAGYQVLARAVGEGLAGDVADFRPDLAILDVSFPRGPDGFALARQLRSDAGVPVLFLTAADELDSRIEGFRAGADDYLVKPFAMAELLARLRAVFRRTGQNAWPTIEVRDLVIDDEEKSVSRDGRRISLTPIEYELLRVLAREPGRVFSKRQLRSLVWAGLGTYDGRVVEVHVSSLRQKLEAHGPRLIHTERNRGYVIRA